MQASVPTPLTTVTELGGGTAIYSTAHVSLNFSVFVFVCARTSCPVTWTTSWHDIYIHTHPHTHTPTHPHTHTHTLQGNQEVGDEDDLFKSIASATLSDHHPSMVSI